MLSKKTSITDGGGDFVFFQGEEEVGGGELKNEKHHEIEGGHTEQIHFIQESQTLKIS